MKIFSVTILSEAERLQIKCLSPKGEFLPASAPYDRGHSTKYFSLPGSAALKGREASICSEASFRMVEKIF